MLALLPLVLAQNAAPDLTRQFEVAEGTRVTLWAESPQLYNPTAIDIDAEGRLWVAEAVNYRQWRGRNPGKHFDEGDRIVVLQDTNADGMADTSTVFVQDKDLTAPLGIAVIGNEVYVSCSPNLYVYRDIDGDLKADEREVFLTGWGGHDHDHGLHSVVAAPGGGLLWCAGNAGPHVVQDASGWNLRSGSQYNGGGASNPGNRAGLKSDDGKLWTGGIIGRIGDDGKDMQVLAHNFRNQYEVAADSFGELYTFDNDDDGNQGCRVVALLEGGDYGYFGRNGASTWNADRRPSQSTLTAHWHQDDPGVMPFGTGTGAGGPTGVAVYEGTYLPDLMGAVFTADAGRSLVFAHQPKLNGAEVKLTSKILIQPSKQHGGDRGHWFRPSDVVVGPDGSIYISDWYDPGVGGHGAGDREAYGRIVRLSPEQAAMSYGMLNTGLDSPSPNVRASAERALLADEANIPPALPNDLRSLARRIYLHAQTDDISPVVQALSHREPQIVHAALRALVANDKFLPQHFNSLVTADERSMALVLTVIAGFAADERMFLLKRWIQAPARFLAAFDPQSRKRESARIQLEAFGLAAAGIEERVFAAALEAGGSGLDLLPFAWRLHPKSALLYLSNFASDASQNETHRRAAIDALGMMSSASAADAMVGLAHAGPPDLADYAAWWVQHNADGPWSSFGLKDMFATDFEQAERIYESEVMSQGMETVALDVSGIETLWLVVEDGGDGNSHDWATFISPQVHTASGVVKLADATWAVSEAGWGQVNRNKDAAGGPIEVGGKVFNEGIGLHAPARVAVRLPKDAQRLVMAVGVEDSGSGQSGARTSLRFVVAGERPDDPAERVARQQAAMSGDQVSLAGLLATTDGAIFLIDQARRGAMPEALLAELAPQLQQHADLSVRALASEIFPLQASDGQALPSLDELASMSGSAARGQELFRSRGTCAVCHQYDGLGGSIGPDLSAIHSKFGRRELLDAMLNPSAAIAFGYDSWTLRLKDGRVLAGSILADGEQVVIRGLDGKRVAVSADQITERHKQVASTMPPAHTIGLGAQDLADLAVFLDSEPAAEPQFGETIELFNGKDLTGWKYFLRERIAAGRVWSVTDGVLRCEGHPVGYLYTAQDYTNFELTLDWRFDPEAGAGNSGVLLRMQEPHKLWPASVEAQLHSENAGDFWNIGEFDMLTDPSRLKGRRTIKMLPTNEKALGEWNSYRILVHGGLIELEVNGELQNRATWCEELAGPIGLQSEGAVIEFRNIRLRPILQD